MNRLTHSERISDKEPEWKNAVGVIPAGSQPTAVEVNWPHDQTRPFRFGGRRDRGAERGEVTGGAMGYGDSSV